MIVSFFVEGEPRPQPRQRHSVAANNKTLRLVRAWKEQVVKAVCAALKRRYPVEKGVEPAFAKDEVLDVETLFYVTRRKTDRDLAPVKACYGDGDNLTKAVWDACTDAGLWVDDCRIAEWYGGRYFADERGPGVQVTVRGRGEL